MASKLIIRINSDDNIEVKVEGLTKADKSCSKGEKLCEKVTKKLEQALGSTIQRCYFDDDKQDIELFEEQDLHLSDE